MATLNLILKKGKKKKTPRAVYGLGWPNVTQNASMKWVWGPLGIFLFKGPFSCQLKAK